jgi:hypothetical protein
MQWIVESHYLSDNSFGARLSKCLFQILSLCYFSLPDVDKYVIDLNNVVDVRLSIQILF